MPLEGTDFWFSAVLTTLLLAGFVTNLLLVSPNVRHLAKIAPSSFLVFWLSSIDSIALLNTLLVAGVNLITGELVLDSVICQLHASVTVFASLASILLCFGLTLFRYLIVVYQVMLPRNFSLGYVVTIVSLASTVAALPFMMGSAEPFYIMLPSRVHCAPNWSLRSVQSSVVILFCFSVSSTTLCFIIYAYTAMVGRVVQVLAYTKGIASSADGNPDVKTGESAISVEIGSIARISKTEKGANKETAEMEKLQRELMIQCIVVVGAFLMGWAPYVIMAVVEYASGSNASPIFDFSVTAIVAFYEMVNPVIVFLYDRDIGRNCKRAYFGASPRGEKRSK
ncbi:hypothetical protein BJ741DRAFT_644513 [Chytriomyces cf. hyalinus JEL632]|nr:hypothetical protein BJ741DRAFT_644513 [Chytriomyces cf. hyalinus JEL632]